MKINIYFFHIESFSKGIIEYLSSLIFKPREKAWIVQIDMGLRNFHPSNTDKKNKKNIEIKNTDKKLEEYTNKKISTLFVYNI